MKKTVLKEEEDYIALIFVGGAKLAHAKIIYAGAHIRRPPAIVAALAKMTFAGGALMWSACENLSSQADHNLTRAFHFCRWHFRSDVHTRLEKKTLIWEMVFLVVGASTATVSVPRLRMAAISTFTKIGCECRDGSTAVDLMHAVYDSNR